MKTNQYSYSVRNGYVRGFFNIYQARNGAIYLMMGNSKTRLTKQQVNELNVDIYSLEDFDHDSFLNAYKEAV
jgi:hypothetical protein